MRIFHMAVGLAIPGLVLAAPMTVDQQADYVLGDEDSLAQARRYCIAEAQRLAVASSGSLIESEVTAATQEQPDQSVSQSASQRARSYNAAIVGSQILSQNLRSEGGKNSLTCTVRITFDPDEVRSKLNDLIGDQTLQRKLQAQQAQIDDLSTRLHNVSAAPIYSPTAPPPASAPPPVAAAPPRFAPPPVMVSAAPPMVAAPPPIPVPPMTSPAPVYYAAPVGVALVPRWRVAYRPVRVCWRPAWAHGRVRCGWY